MHFGMCHEVNDLCSMVFSGRWPLFEQNRHEKIWNLEHLIDYSVLLAMGWNEFALHYGSKTYVLGAFEINDLCLDSKIAFKNM